MTRRDLVDDAPRSDLLGDLAPRPLAAGTAGLLGRRVPPDQGIQLPALLGTQFNLWGRRTTHLWLLLVSPARRLQSSDHSYTSGTFEPKCTRWHVRTGSPSRCPSARCFCCWWAA